MSLKEILQKKIKTGIKSANELGQIERLRTGIASLDTILGGGIPKGRVTQIWGPESVGKSSLCLSIIKGMQDQDPTAEAIYVDAERTVHKGDIDVQGLDGNRLVFFEAFGGEEAIDTALDALQAGAKLAVIDSVPYLRPIKVLSEIEKDSSYRDVSSIALLMERVQHKIVKTVQNTNGVLIFINQQRPPKGMYAAPTYPGGSALSFMLSCSINITSASKEKDNASMMQQNLVIRKNKTFTPMLKGTIPMQNRVCLRGQSLVEACVQHGLINKKGGGYLEISEALAAELGIKHKLGQGVEKVGLELEKNQNAYEALYDLLISTACVRDCKSFEEEISPLEVIDVDY